VTYGAGKVAVRAAPSKAAGTPRALPCWVPALALHCRRAGSLSTQGVAHHSLGWRPCTQEHPGRPHRLGPSRRMAHGLLSVGQNVRSANCSETPRQGLWAASRLTGWLVPSPQDCVVPRAPASMYLADKGSWPRSRRARSTSVRSLKWRLHRELARSHRCLRPWSLITCGKWSLGMPSC